MAKRDSAAAAAIMPANTNTTEIVSAADAFDPFADFGDLATDGLSELDASDLKLPIVVWNMKGTYEAVDEHGRKVQKMRQLNEFYDTLNEVSFPALTCVLLDMHKTNSFTRFDNDKNETVVHCTSYDRETGRLRTAHPDLPELPAGCERPCDGCVDKNWRRDAKGKNVRNCDDVSAIFAEHIDAQGRPTGERFLMRFKRTSMPPLVKHLNQHHINRRKLANGKVVNMPLFAFPVRITLKVSENGNFATPEFERGAFFPREVLADLAESAKFVREIGQEASEAAEKQEARHAADDGSAPSGGQAVGGDDFTA
jgi:hypothetical protein